MPLCLGLLSLSLVCVCVFVSKKKKNKKKKGLGLERIMHKSIKLSNSLLAQLTPLGGLKVLHRSQFSNAHSLNYLIKKTIYICVCQNICNNNAINMSENKDNMDLEQSNSKLKIRT